jgi:hypothetical protein
MSQTLARYSAIRNHRQGDAGLPSHLVSRWSLSLGRPADGLRLRLFHPRAGRPLVPHTQSRRQATPASPASPPLCR